MVGKEPLSDQLSAREKEILERLSAGLTDQQIADQLFLSLNTVKWYNRQIYSKLGVSSRTQAIKHAHNFTILLSNTSPSSPLISPQSHLPTPITPLIGRTRELEELKCLLQANRLVTLTGTGGIGKTRLALRLASELADAFAHGIYFVDLAPLSDHNQVAKAISEALGIIEDSAVSLLDSLKRVLNDQESLLLIDNFEHVIAAAPLVSDLLGTALRLKVLVTSRETLHLTGEQEYPVPPLSLPPVDRESINDVMTSESVALFVQRARMTFPGFAIVNSNASVVAQICARLDGLPLAIELAAARSKFLPPQALLERLDSRLTALTGGLRDVPMRQRTLRDTLEWSYNLLDDSERILFARLSVFRGGRSLEAIEAVCGHDLPAQVLDSLASLVDKNLIQQKEMPQGEPRFVMLETIHEYARERLIASGEAETIFRRHALHFAELTERAEPELRRMYQKYWFQLLEVEIDNLRAALQWSLEGGDILCGVRIVSGTGLYWVVYGRQDEGIRWSQRLMARVDEVPLTDQAHLFRSTIYLTSYRDREAAIWLGRQSIDMARKSGDKMQLAMALMMLSGVLVGDTELEPLAQQALTLYQKLDDKSGLAWVYNVFGEHARICGDDEGAIRAYAEALAIAEQIGETRLQYTVLYNSAFVAQHKGDHREAVRLLRRSIAICRDMGVPTAPVALLSIAGSLGAAGEPLQAARLFGAAQAILQRKGMLVHPDDQPEHDRNITAVRAQLGEVAFAAAFVEGREMTLDEALEVIPEALR
ncbi:MAG TPA: LuxR C-terminal-related transcriptional regulator [Phototrophicaceae bacterium]|jgi:predicted ATPase/DNA-binding CsgD family transcriptional regulator|nr:LuxR C-terminal-related transcriptional regulator [Phototrophicaceae bacterium]